jgi:hypothetical protein
MALHRVPDIRVSTCAGVESREVYDVNGVAIETNTGAPVRVLGAAKLVRKGANACGGIGAAPEPAAQVAASVLALVGEVVIDPFNETVWLKGGR